jgi:tRNA(Ile)-lysidine synthase
MRLYRFALRASSGRTLELGDGWVAESTFDRLRIRRWDRAESALGTLSLTAADGEAEFGPWILRWRPGVAGAVRRGGAGTWIEPGEVAVRGWRPGDRIIPLGGVGSRKVRRVLMEARIPAADRHRYPLVVRGDDVVWIPDVCRAALAVPQPGTDAIRLDAERRSD